MLRATPDCLDCLEIEESLATPDKREIPAQLVSLAKLEKMVCPACLVSKVTPAMETLDYLVCPE